MKKNILILMCLVILVVIPNLVLADCTSLGYFTSFTVTGSNTVTLYWMNIPFVKFDVQGSIEPTSKLQLIKGDQRLYQRTAENHPVYSLNHSVLSCFRTHIDS